MYDKEVGYYYYLFKEKMPNNQTLNMKFWIEDDWMYIETAVYSKRKRAWKSSKKRGSMGVKSLLLAKLGIKLFIDFIYEKRLNRNRDIKIVVGWTDARRQRVYARGLKDLGFVYENLNFGDKSLKHLIKNIKKESVCQNIKQQ